MNEKGRKNIYKILFIVSVSGYWDYRLFCFAYTIFFFFSKQVLFYKTDMGLV